MTTTRIEFAPGHEDEAITEQDVRARMLKMKAAEQMYGALQELLMWGIDTNYEKAAAAVQRARAAIAAAEGRSHQEQS